MRGKATKRAVDALRPGDFIADTDCRGFIVRRLPSGALNYGFRFRHRATGRRRWLALGGSSLTVDQARRLALRAAGQVAEGSDPQADHQADREAARIGGERTVNVVLDDFMARYVRERGLRSGDEIEATFRRHVREALGDKPILELRKRDIVELLDRVADQAGPMAADSVLKLLRKAFNWFAARDDEFRSPIVKGMARIKPADRRRSRILSDNEIRLLFRALEAPDAAFGESGKMPGCFPRFLRALLFSAQRRDEVAGMRWEEIDGDAWIIARDRYKTGREHVVPITPRLGKEIGAKGRGYVFSNRSGKSAFSGFSKAKRALDARMARLLVTDDPKAEEIERWTLHDLRRTARSLMARAGIPSEIAERVVGHAIKGIEATYNRHDYFQEKRKALEALASLVERILAPPTENVVRLKGK